MSDIFPRRIGIYAGTFDPVTKGHLQLIKRASKLVDHLIVAVAVNEKKNPLFTLQERLDLLETDVRNMHETSCPIEVKPFDNLLVHFAAEQKASCLFRGLRAVSDFEFEFQMTGMNARLAPELETVFLMASDKYQFVSSAFVKEIYSLGGDISEVVTPNVVNALKSKFGK
ncbi:MAG: pantetheine-phosphate adenylyltransferase [Rhodospirillales bacterium]|nr:pantetheine-phosphate adenylyltransferase [Rhodospirillales bacterium]MCB9980446.1 pantetheine-phosphate adenylyltransferase [Rhodospirillales bacterium]